MKTKFQTLIIDRLRNIRKAHNISQAFVARHLGISHGQIGNIESYKQNHKYTLRQIKELSELFGVTIEQVFSTDELVVEQGNTTNLIEQIIKYQNDKEENNK